MLKWRLSLGALIILALVALCAWDARADRPGDAGLPCAALMPVFLLLTVLATQEVLRLARAAGIHPVAGSVYAANVLLVLAQWLPEVNLYVHRVAGGRAFDYLSYIHWIHSASRSPLWALGLGVLIIFAAEMQRFERPGGALANISVGVFCLIYVGLMCTFVIQIRLFWGVGALATWILAVKMGDIGAYLVGRLFGTRKMSPTISPGKTVEGGWGALIFALIGSWIGFHIALPLAPPAIEPLPGESVGWFVRGVPVGWVIFGLLMGSVGMLGDLAESLLKRDVGCKDSSSWLPGFGGVLDIIDSLLLSAPIAWLCWSVGIVGFGISS